MKFRIFLAWSVVLCLSYGFCAPIAQAHHSFALFDKNKFMKIKGVVVRFDWENPHSYIVLDVDDHGKAKRYTFECSSLNELSRWGWEPHILKVGDTVTVGAYPMRNGEPAGLVATVTMANGKTLKAH